MRRTAFFASDAWRQFVQHRPEPIGMVAPAADALRIDRPPHLRAAGTADPAVLLEKQLARRIIGQIQEPKRAA